MSATPNDLLQQLLCVCAPDVPLIPSDGAANLRLTGEKHTRQPRYLFSRKHTLWTASCSHYCYAFSVSELNFDSLAQCHIAALESGAAHFDPAAKHSTTCVTAVIVCDTAQADALEALSRFKKRIGCPLSPKARLVYRLAAVDRSTGEVVCNRRARRLKSALLAQLSANDTQTL